MSTSPADFNAQVIEDFRATGGEATGEERDRLYRTRAERVPQFGEYEKLSDRVIPVIVLTPTSA
jgi:hypothetical protein